MKNSTEVSVFRVQPLKAAQVLGLILMMVPVTGLVLAQGDKAEFFEMKIRPVLAGQCYECHSAQAKSVKGGLRLDTKAALATGGDGGPVVVPGKPDESPLFQAIAYQGDAEKMPPKGKLPDGVINDFRKWITDGAFDPRPDASGDKPVIATAAGSWQETFQKRADWWSFKPLKSAEPPKLDFKNPVDRFLAAKLNAQKLQFAPEAGRATLLRRLYFDLLGLPPTEAELDAFLADSSPDAYEKQVDRLLNSPHYGERLARRWMDLTHYTETVGSEQDALIPYAWAYRDYLIRAFNNDLPYNQLLKEHLAGDLVKPARRDQKTGLAESPVGTSWTRFVEYYHSPVDVKNEEITVLDNQIDTFGKTFLGLTLACARCHDHKFDPISADDFYRLYGVFRTARATVHELADVNAMKPLVIAAGEKKMETRNRLQSQWMSDLANLNQVMTNAFQPGKPLNPALATFFDMAVKSPRKWGHAFAMAQKAVAEKRDLNQAWNDARKVVGENHPASWNKKGAKQKLLADFSSPTDFPSGWTLRTPMNPTHSRAGTFHLGYKPDQLVDAIRPSGFFSDAVTEKMGATLRSPEFTLKGGAYHVLVSGTANARLRLVVDNFQGVDILFAGVTPALNNPRLAWVKLPVRDIWKGRQAYIELVTRDEMPSTGVIRDLNLLPRDGRSSIGIKYVVHADQAEAVAEESPAFADSPGNNNSGDHQNAVSPESLAYLLSKNIAEAVIAFGYDQLTDAQTALLQDLIDSRVLSNSTTAGSQLSQAINAYRAAEEKIDFSAKSVGVSEQPGANIQQHLFVRGDHKRNGKATPPGQIQLLRQGNETFTDGQPQRLQLAESLADPKNPLVSRVMVNRVWAWCFGAGLFPTLDNVGHLGEPPSHPELLDWLATQFTGDGWSVKKLTRLLVTSQAYRQSSKPLHEAFQLDPANRLLSHASLKRLDAESLRDAVLTSSGRLDRTLYGLPLPTPQPPGLTDDKKPVSGPIDGAGRRSLYLNVRKNFPVEFLEVFDRPRPTLTVGKRNTSNQPAQALAMMNDPFVRGEAERLGRLMEADKTRDNTAKMKSLYRRTLGRSPRENEIERGLAFIRTGGGWAELAQALFETKEFLYLD